MQTKHIAILGSTGSIGRQTLEVVEQMPHKFSVHTLTANNQVDLLIEQAQRFCPEYVVIGNPKLYDRLKQGVSGLSTRAAAGDQAIKEAVRADKIDVVLTAMVGYSGLSPTIAAIEAGKDIALANKETLVVAGELITTLAKQHKVRLLPVDSEHSAIFQCMEGEKSENIEKIYLTASGGPFRGMSANDLKKVKLADALKHPNWDMGNKITIDSASMMNKGLEAIEAKWLFGLQHGQIDVIIHPQSVIHSIVQFTDGSMKAQMGLPDMKLPILYALSYPERQLSEFERFDFLNYPQLTFEEARSDVFGNLRLAYSAMEKGGNAPCVLNAANEVAVAAFIAEKISFTALPVVVENALDNMQFIKNPSLNDLINTHTHSCQQAAAFITKNYK